VQAELARLGQLAEAGAETEKGVAADARGEVGDGELDVVDLCTGMGCKSWFGGWAVDEVGVGGAYAGVVQPENVAVTVFEGSD
jgi:hypothetical protein